MRTLKLAMDPLGILNPGKGWVAKGRDPPKLAFRSIGPKTQSQRLLLVGVVSFAASHLSRCSTLALPCFGIAGCGLIASP